MAKSKNILLPSFTSDEALAVYTTIGNLISSMPDLLGSGGYDAERLLWLGRAYAQIEAVFGQTVDAISFKQQMDTAVAHHDKFLRETAVGMMQSILYRALAYSESLAPAAAQGAYIPAGSVFDAMAAISKILSAAQQEALIIDPYMDEKALTDFAGLAQAGVTIKLLADSAAVKSTLQPAGNRWLAQHGASRPLQVRLSAPKALHDRLIIVDMKDSWLLGQSLNAFAQRAPASIVRADPEISALKVQGYGAIWTAATVVI